MPKPFQGCSSSYAEKHVQGMCIVDIDLPDVNGCSSFVWKNRSWTKVTKFSGSWDVPIIWWSRKSKKMVSDKNLTVGCFFTLIFIGSVAAQGIRFPDQDHPGSGLPDPSGPRLGSALVESESGQETSTEQPPTVDASAIRFATFGISLPC